MGDPTEPGTILAGKYQVDKVLGEGGMGVVVAATDTQLERRVAIKFLLPEYAEHHEAAQRFMREARAAVKIQSEHIARVIDVNRMENGSPYMVMEYLQGGDLSNVLASRGPLPIEEATLYVLQAGEAIAEAHSYGIVHRDLKPANLFLAQQPDGSSKIKVLDFGISKMTMTSAGIDPSLTRTTSMMGSPLYMSPEQMRSTRDVDARTDIWALGVILYELLTGTLPFTADSIPVLSAKILLEDPESLRAKRADVPEALEQIILRTLIKDPTGRFPSVSELALALLPFAPKRARQNVERITKVLESAGLSSSQLHGSMHPTTHGPGATTGDVVRAVAGSAVPGVSGGVLRTAESAATQVNFGQTNGPRRTRAVNLGLVLGAAVALLLVGGGVVFFALKTSPSPVATEQVTGEPAAKPALAQAAAAAPVKAPEPAVAPTTTAEPEPELEPPAASSSAAPEAQAAPPPRTPNVVARTTKQVNAKATSKTTSTKSTPVTEPSSGGFRSRFGSRK